MKNALKILLCTLLLSVVSACSGYEPGTNESVDVTASINRTTAGQNSAGSASSPAVSTGSGGTVQMKYQPVGCQDIPWQEWYFKNTSGFTTVPSERSLATAYYAKEVQASLFDFKRVVVSRGCTDCNTCPRDYYIATVKGSDAEKMRNTGWAQV